VEVIERDDDPLRFADMVKPEENIIARLGILGIEINQKTSQMLPTCERSTAWWWRARGRLYLLHCFRSRRCNLCCQRRVVTSVAALREALDKLKPPILPSCRSSVTDG